MEDNGNNAGLFESAYNKLTYPDDNSGDEHSFNLNQERQQVSLSTLWPGSRLNRYKVLAVSLAVLAAFLLAVDIGLGVYYLRLTYGNHLVTDINTEIAKLQTTYNAVLQSKTEAKQEVVKEIKSQQIAKWELDHLNRRKRDNEKLIDRFETEIAMLESHMPMLNLRLTYGNHLVTDINTEIAKLQTTYNAVLQSKTEAKQEVVKEIKSQQIAKWELDHLNRRKRDNEKLIDRFETEIAMLESHMPMLKEGCRQCLPGWTVINSMCYFFALSEELSRRSWMDARHFCKRQGSDLLVINSREEHMALAEMVKMTRDASRAMSQSGFWIGLRDADAEGIWTWLDGTRVDEGYWNLGEPNNQNNEDCAAMYPRENPFNSWNDAPCSWNLKWICERTPRPFSSSLNV